MGLDMSLDSIATFGYWHNFDLIATFGYYGVFVPVVVIVPLRIIEKTFFIQITFSTDLYIKETSL
jgi:hypothetical protein